jgi:hypothetical protein
MYQRYHMVWLSPDGKSTYDVYWNVDDGAVAGYTGPGPGWTLLSNNIESFNPSYSAAQGPPPPQSQIVPSLQPITVPVAPPAVTSAVTAPPNTPLQTAVGGVFPPVAASVNGSQPVVSPVIPNGMAAQFNFRMFLHSPLTMGALVIIIVALLVTRKGGL